MMGGHASLPSKFISNFKNIIQVGRGAEYSLALYPCELISTLQKTIHTCLDS